MIYNDLRLEFIRKSFREKLLKQLGRTCVNCGVNENIEYHHIVPLINGGTNKLSNIVPLCFECHSKAHDKKRFKNKCGGRPKINTFENSEHILKKYFDLEIGTKEAKKLIGISINNKSTWSELTNQYRKEYNINKDFKNTIDRQTVQKQIENTKKLKREL